MQKPNPVIKNYILSSKPLILNDKTPYANSISCYYQYKLPFKNLLQQDFFGKFPPMEVYNR